MTKEQAIQLLLRAVSIAQSKGAFTLGDARLVADAVDVLNPAPEPAALPGKEDEPVQETTKA